MQLGMVGLGRMGANIVRRLMRDGHECVVYDVSREAVAQLEGEGATGSTSLDDFVAKLTVPRRAWVMVPAGSITESTVKELGARLEAGDTIIDGGNSYYRDDIRRAAELGARGIHYLDCGTSGGVFGLERGFCLMIGGDADAFAGAEPVFASLAPGVAAAPRTPGRAGEPAAEENGYLYCGPSGAGHFVKMVHNGIEYGMMAAIAEGLDILHGADAGLRDRDADAETAPLDNPEYYRYELDIPAVAELWRRGSVVGSWLLDLTAAALQQSPGLEGFEGRVSDSGEGRWTSIAAIEEGVPADVLTAALYSRFASRNDGLFGNKILSAMRSQFGGHHEKPAS
jgi:6-phosphogluconate dehydrogenase